MNAKHNDWIWMYLGVALLATVFAFVLPDAAIADECSSQDCEIEVIGENLEGECGEAHGGEDPDCACWSGEIHDHQPDHCGEGPIDP